MDTSKRILLFSVGVILVVSFIAIGMTIFNKSKSSIGNTSSQYDQLVSQYDDLGYSSLGSTVSGSEVIALVQSLKSKNDGVSIIVKNGQNGSAGTGTTYTSSSTDAVIAKMSEKTANSTTYVNPSATFKVEITRDKNNVVTTVTFTQQ